VNADQYRRVSGAVSAVSFSRTERQTAAEVFQNISSEDGRELLARYDGIFHKIEQYTSVVSRGPKLPALESLPTSFNELSGGRATTSWLTLSDDQIQSGINKYKAALELAKEQARDVVPDSVGKQLKEIQSEFDKIGDNLKHEEEAESSLVADLEKQIASSARSIYGNAVGSDSFTYLLVVFFLVFVIIMILPKLYTPDIAANILKAEFLLQFSTVFVLIAAIIILGIGRFIAQDQLPVLLAGISGYVLGQLGRVGVGPGPIAPQNPPA
jgi:hypothetical protein